jgi:hypothetical protein
LLFRDSLRDNPGVRDHWLHFKQRLADSVPDLFAYGQIKQPATMVLFAAAEQWAMQTGWVPDATRSSVVKRRLDAIGRLAPIMAQRGGIKLGDQHPDECGHRHLARGHMNRRA